MGRIDMPFVDTTSTKGKTYRYYRRDGRRIRLIGEPGSPEFASSYQAAQRQFEIPAVPDKGETLAALVVAYKASPEYKALASATQLGYGIHLDALTETYGHCALDGLTRKVGYTIRDKLSAVPSSANQRIRILRLIMNWAVKRDWLKTNPIVEIEPLKTGDGAKSWPDTLLDRAAGELSGATLTAFMLALYTGQRLGDVLAMKWGDILDGRIQVKQGKTGEELEIPQHPKLRAHLKAIKKSAKGVYIVGRRDGRPLTTDGFKTLWHRAMTNMGVKGYAFHGLRKTAAARLAEAGCTEKQIASITGHKTLAMVQHYTRQADQKRLSDEAMKLWSKRRTAKRKRDALPNRSQTEK